MNYLDYVQCNYDLDTPLGMRNDGTPIFASSLSDNLLQYNSFINTLSEVDKCAKNMYYVLEEDINIDEEMMI